LTITHKPFKDLLKSCSAFAVGSFWSYYKLVLYYPLRVSFLFKVEFAIMRTWKASVGAFLKSTDFKMHLQKLIFNSLDNFCFVFKAPWSTSFLYFSRNKPPSANEVRKYSEI